MNAKSSTTTLPSIKRLFNEYPDDAHHINEESHYNHWPDTPYAEQKSLMSLRTLIHPIPLEPSIPNVNNTTTTTTITATAGLTVKHNHHHSGIQSDETAKMMRSKTVHFHDLHRREGHVNLSYHRRAFSEQTFDFVQKHQQPCISANHIHHAASINSPHHHHEDNIYDNESDSTSYASSPPTTPPFIPSYYENHQNIRLPGQLLNKYICPQCNKGFTRPSSLKTHIYSHTGEKPYACGYPTCNKRFSVQSNMRRHMKVHPTISPTTI